MSTPIIDLHRARHPSQAEAQRNKGEQGRQPSNISRIRVLRGLVWLDNIVPLPQTLKGYFLFLSALLVVCGLALFQVWTSLRITQARGELEALRVQYSLIEQKNAELLWQIGQRTTLERVQTRAVQLNFRPTLKHKYIPNAYNVENAVSVTTMDRDQWIVDRDTSREPRATNHYPQSTAGAHPTTSDGPFPWSVPKRFPVAEFEQLVSSWKQQANERWQAGSQAVRQWSEPLLERVSDFILGQLKQP